METHRGGAYEETAQATPTDRRYLLIALLLVFQLISSIIVGLTSVVTNLLATVFLIGSVAGWIANAPQEYADRSLLWNSVEWNETKFYAQLARPIELALPAELNHEQNIAMVRKLVQELFVDKGTQI